MLKLTTTLVMAALLLLAGCGQMGPLYEPEDESPGSAQSQADGHTPSSVA